MVVGSPLSNNFLGSVWLRRDVAFIEDIQGHSLGLEFHLFRKILRDAA
jgi:hypothetical protein